MSHLHHQPRHKCRDWQSDQSNDADSSLTHLDQAHELAGGGPAPASGLHALHTTGGHIKAHHKLTAWHVNACSATSMMGKPRRSLALTKSKEQKAQWNLVMHRGSCTSCSRLGAHRLFWVASCESLPLPLTFLSCTGGDQQALPWGLQGSCEGSMWRDACEGQHVNMGVMIEGAFPGACRGHVRGSMW